MRPVTFRFGDVEFDVGRRTVERNGCVVPLQRKPLDLLIYLIERRTRAVGKDEILRDLWPDEFVSESSLSVCIRKIRKALGDDDSNPPIIATLHGFGYRFVAEVMDSPDLGADDAGTDSARDVAPAIVGRTDELGLLRSIWRRACTGQRQVVLVCGEGGIGKSALVHAFLDELTTSEGDVAVLHGDCLDLRGRHEPYLPLLDAWTQECRGPRGASAIEVLRRYAPGWLLQLHGVVADEERARLQDDSRGVIPERLLRMLTAAFNELASLHPTILVVEDLHWADSATLDALARLAHDRERVPFFLLATLRPDFNAHSGRMLFDWVTLLRRQRIATEIALGCLDAKSVTAFLATTASTIGPPADVGPSLWERTRGHPLFLRAVVRHLEQGGRLDEVPPELHLMIDFEFEALAAFEQRLVEAAATVGTEFAAALVAAALDAPDADVEEAMLGIVRRHRVLDAAGTIDWPDGTTSRRFRFRHPFYVDVALQRAAKARQAAWHGNVSARLRQAFPDLPGTIALRIAWHLERAGDVAAALEGYEVAIAVAQQEYSHERVETAATVALQLLAQLPASAERDAREISLRIALGAALVATRGYVTTALRENCERGLEVARAAEAIGPQMIALLTLSAIHQTRGDCASARTRAEELVDLVERMLPGPPHTLAQARLGQILAVEGQLDAALERLLPARNIVVDIDTRATFGSALWLDPEVTIHGFLGPLLLVLGYPDQGQREIDEATRRGEKLHDGLSAATAHILAVGFHAIADDAATVRVHCDRFVELALADGLMQASERGLLGCLARAIEPQDEASVLHLDAAIRDHGRREIHHMAPLLYSILAEAWRRLGRFGKALDALDAAQARIATGGEQVFLAEIHRLRGECLRGAGSSYDQLAVAEMELDAAIAIAREQRARWFELKAITSKVHLLRAQRRGPEALPSLAALYGWFREGFDRPALRAAAALLSDDR